jgi:hypothetical protein
VVLGQVDVEAKTNEIPMFGTLLDRVGPAGAVVGASRFPGALRAVRRVAHVNPPAGLYHSDWFVDAQLLTHFWYDQVE